MAKKLLTVLLLPVFILLFSAGYTYALWPDKGKESKLEKDSYEKLVAKNLELRNEVDTLTKEQEQVRGIYKVLLEKVKALQNDSAMTQKEKEDAVAAAALAHRTIENLKGELADAKKGIVQPEEAAREAGPGAEKEDLRQEIENMKRDSAEREERSNRLMGELKTALRDRDAARAQLEEAGRALREKDGLIAAGSGRDERIKTLEAELDRANAGLRSAEDASKTRGEDVKRLEGIFDKSALKKRYPEAFARRDEAEKFMASEAAEGVKQAVDELSARQKARREEAAALDREIEHERAGEEELKNRTESADRKISELKESIENLNAEVKSRSDRAPDEEGRIKELESSMETAAGEEKGLEAGREEVSKKIGQIKESIKKAGVNRLKDSAGFRSEEVKLLEKDLEKAVGEEKDLSQKIQDAGAKAEDLKAAISAAEARSKKGAGETASAKQKIGDMEKEIAKNEAEAAASKKELEHLMKNMEALKSRRGVFITGIEEEDEKIRGLKNIIGKNVIEIEQAGESQWAVAGALPDKVEGVLAALNDEIKELKARNAELEKNLKYTAQAAKKAERKAASNKDLPAELTAKVNKERLDMHYNLAVVYDKNGMYKDAEREYLKCLKISMKHRILLFIFIGLFVPASLCYSETIVLRSGKTVEGIMQEKDKQINELEDQLTEVLTQFEE